ncbi:MAG TPA: sodium/glutamate symporter [Vicinamibacterales bacterium]|nr:sodium/glutamate symporter [Vicinamibacterales bacterium]
MLALDLVNTVALAGVVLFAGYGLRRAIPVLARLNIPAPVVGGFLVAIAMTIAYHRGAEVARFDTTLQTPLQNAFFTSIGFGASLQLLRQGGPLVLRFFIFAGLVAILQNAVGAAVAVALGKEPLLGVLAGSVTLTGGPATGLAFAPLFEAAGVEGAATVAVMAAMVGIVFGGLVGAPIATMLLERRRVSLPGPRATPPLHDSATRIVEEQVPEPPLTAPAGEDPEAYVLLKHLILMLVAIWLGGFISRALVGVGWTLPSYIGAMLVASVIRNLDDILGLFGLSQQTLDDLGAVALSLFLAMALMTLRLWELAGLAIPLTIILVVQVALVAAIAAVLVPPLMGRDYESIVMAGGFVGFMLGTTANAMANMSALVERYGPAPKAFLTVPLVGAFFIDFANAVLITFCLNLFG